jgi:hypothetical protein
MTTENPLFQLVSQSPQNNLIFFTQMNEQWTRGGGNWCCICGVYELQIIPVDVRQQTSMCLHCFTSKLRQDKKIKDMRKPFELSEQIFCSHIKTEQKPHTQIIPITHPTY